MDTIINLGIPHIGEQIFQNLEIEDLVRCREVSTTWKILVENVVFKKWKGDIHFACMEGQTEVIKILLEHPKSETIEWNAEDRHGRSALIIAVIHEDIDLLKLILDHSDVNGIDLNAIDNDLGMTPLIRAICENNYEVVKLLLNHSNGRNIDLNAKDKYGNTAFIDACRGDDIKVLKMFLSYPNSEQIDFNARNRYGYTGCEAACKREKFEKVELLHEYCTMINIEMPTPSPRFSDAINDILKRRTRKGREN